jgi:hypothetical protein
MSSDAEGKQYGLVQSFLKSDVQELLCATLFCGEVGRDGKVDYVVNITWFSRLIAVGPFL